VIHRIKLEIASLGKSVFCLLAVNIMPTVQAEEHGQHDKHQHHNMSLDNSGMVMNGNHNRLPQNCEKIGNDYQIKVYAGTKFAMDYPGTVFGMSQHEHRVDPCSRITVTFINEDEIRHQWMVHGLPRYIYPGGMFHLEAAGGQSQTGTFIVPGDDKTYLIHCDMAQHMEKGMKAQLIIGKGSGDLWAVPGVSAGFTQDSYLPEDTELYIIVIFIAGIVVTTLVITGKQS